MAGLRTGPEAAVQYGSGFTAQLSPRYSPLGCSSSDSVKLNNASGPNDLHKKGLAHVGLLPQLRSDPRTVGTPSYYLDHLNRSAENFPRVWERGVSLVTSQQTGTWTSWLNRDGPSGSGDWETTSGCATSAPRPPAAGTVSGASGSGDTYLRLYGPGGTQVAASDDSCGLRSSLSFTASQSGLYQIRAGCYSSGSCGGTVAYTLQ